VRDASFVDDLFADSIRLVEMMLRLKEEGITIPMEEAWNVRTVGDAYRVYSSHVDNNDTIKKPPTGTS
jgi:acyl carrier protein